MIKRLLAKPLEAAQVDWLIEQELARLVACGPARVYLIGSAARAAMTDQSDLDFVVLCATLAEMKTIKDRYYKSRRGDVWPTDVVFLTVADYEKKAVIGGIAMVCAQEGRLLFKEKSP